MLTRNVDESYFTEGDRSVDQMMQNTYEEASNVNLAYWSEADTDLRFLAGDQELYNNYYGNMPAARRKKFFFNRMRRVINMITGYQRQNRKQIITVPVEHDDDLSSSQWTKVISHVQNAAKGNEVISRGFELGSLITGMSLLGFSLNKCADPVSGDIEMENIAYNSFIIDPYFRKTNLSDCNYIWRRKWLSKTAVKGMLPESLGEFIDSLQPRGNKDGKFQFMAESYNYATNKLLSYDEYWYLCTRTTTFLIDPEIGLSKEWKGDDEQLQQFLSHYKGLIVKKINKPTVKLVIQVEGRTVYNGPNPLNIDRYPFAAMLGYYEPEISYFPLRAQGVIRGLRDSQFLYNRRKIIELDILESQVNSGYKYKPTSLVNPKDIFMSGQGKGIAVKQEASLDDVQEIQPGQIPQSMIALSEALGREIQEISGVNEELLGSAQDDKAGILSMLRQGAGLTTLQKLFDQLESAQRDCGEIIVEIVQNNYSYGKIERIIGETPVPEFKNKAFLKYDIRVEEGILTSTQRQLQFAQLMHLREMGLPIPSKTLIQAATLQDKKQLIEDIEAEEQKAQQDQQLQLQTQIQLLQAQIEDLQGKSLANQGLGIERISRISENEMLSEERRAQAIENISDARLNRAKTLKELEDIDVTQIQKLLEIAQMLKTTESETAEFSDKNR